MLDLKALIGKLDRHTRRVMEQAAALCMAQTHFDVEAEHVLQALLRQNHPMVRALLDRYGLDEICLLGEIEAALGKLPRGNTRTPAFSRRVPEMLSAALLSSAAVLNSPLITLPSLLLAPLGDEPLRGLLLGAMPSLGKIDVTEGLALLPELASELTAVRAPGMPTPPTSGRASRGDGQPQTSDALARYTVDLTQMARDGAIDAVIGRDREIRQVMDVMMRRRQNNPILVGEPGVGKTAVVEGLALRIIAGEVPPPLAGMTVRILDLGLLQAGAGVKGEFEERLKSVISEVKASAGNTVVFVDEAHGLIGAGGQAGHNDAANLLKPALARGEFRTIAATTWAEYKRYFEKDAALARRFQPISVNEPDQPAAMAMLRGLTSRLEAHHRVAIDDAAVSAAVALSARYIPARQLPDKAISVLDTACARIAIHRALTGDSPAAATDWQVGSGAVAEVVAEWTGIPVGAMGVDEAQTILGLEKSLAGRIVGQPQAMSAIARVAIGHRAGLSEPNRPVGVFLLCGPSGVGKTETAQALAELLYGGDAGLITINMSEYQEAHSVAKLKGAPPGYVGFGTGGVLTEAVRRRPYSVVLLDEIDKAHGDILDMFYQVFDKGVLEDGEGVAVDFRNTLILMTGNLAEEELLAAAGGLRAGNHSTAALLEAAQATVVPVLRRRFAPAFLGRLAVVPYLPLGEQDIRRIVDMRCQRLSQRFSDRQGMTLAISDAAREEIIRRVLAADAGARMVDHILNNRVIPDLAAMVLETLAGTRMASRMLVDLGADRQLTVQMLPETDLFTDAAA